MQASCSSSECDSYFAFSIGDQEYLTFVTDFDGYYELTYGSPRPHGLFVYPACGSSSIESGDPSGIIPEEPNFAKTNMRNAMAGGDQEQFGQLTETANGENFPITFEFINNANSGSFTFKFWSPTFTTPLECTYGSAVAIGQDFKFYTTPDGGSEIVLVESFEVTGYDILQHKTYDIFICFYMFIQCDYEHDVCSCGFVI